MPEASGEDRVAIENNAAEIDPTGLLLAAQTELREVPERQGQFRIFCFLRSFKVRAKGEFVIESDNLPRYYPIDGFKIALRAVIDPAGLARYARIVGGPRSSRPLRRGRTFAA